MRKFWVALVVLAPIAITVAGWFFTRWLYSTAVGSSLPQEETKPFFVLAMAAMAGTVAFIVLLRIAIERWPRWK